MTLRPTQLLRSGLHSLVRLASRNYIAGPTIEDAMRVSRVLALRGYGITLGYWDADSDTPPQVLQTYLDCCQQLAGLGDGNYVSIKIPALQFDTRMYRTLRDQSRNCRVPLNFDALEISSASPTLDFIAAHTDPRIDEVGIVLPGRWRRSLEDADRANDLGLVVRVVKGQSADPAEPDRDPRHGFTEVITKLAGRARCVRVASHNALVARESLSLLRAAGTRAELELLYGLPLGNQLALAREFNVPVRVYVAFGHAFLPYAMQSLRRHPGGVLRLLREAARGDCLSGFPVFPGAGPIRSAR